MIDTVFKSKKKKSFCIQLDKQYHRATFRKRLRVKDQNSEVILQAEKTQSYLFTVISFIEALITDNMRVSVCKST